MGRKSSFSQQDITRETTMLAHLFALLYYHFGATLIAELGEKRGRRLIEKAVKDFALDRGRRMKSQVLSLGKRPNFKNYHLVRDLPEHTFWDTPEGRTHCPFADIWEKKGSFGQALGLLYCNTNDPWKIKGYNPQAKLWRWVKNRNLGDGMCKGQKAIQT